MENSKNSQQFETQVLQLLNKIYSHLISFEESVNSRFEDLAKRIDSIDIRLNNIDRRLNGMDERLYSTEDKVDLNSRKHDWIFSPENTYVTEGRLHDFAEKNNLSYPKPE